MRMSLLEDDLSRVLEIPCQYFRLVVGEDFVQFSIPRLASSRLRLANDELTQSHTFVTQIETIYFAFAIFWLEILPQLGLNSTRESTSSTPSVP